MSVYYSIFNSIVICFSFVALAQSPFAGKWQTKTSRVTGKPTITLSIAESENRLSGTLLLHRMRTFSRFSAHPWAVS